MIGYVKIFKDKGRDKKNNNKLKSLYIDYDKLLEKYKTIQTQIWDFNKFELHALLVCDNRYLKTTLAKYGNKVYTNFCDVNLPENGAECESFTVISIDSLFVYGSKHYLHVSLDNCSSKVVDKEMIDCLDDNLFETD